MYESLVGSGRYGVRCAGSEQGIQEGLTPSVRFPCLANSLASPWACEPQLTPVTSEGPAMAPLQVEEPDLSPSAASRGGALLFCCLRDTDDSENDRSASKGNSSQLPDPSGLPAASLTSQPPGHLGLCPLRADPELWGHRGRRGRGTSSCLT